GVEVDFFLDLGRILKHSSGLSRVGPEVRRRCPGIDPGQTLLFLSYVKEKPSILRAVFSTFLLLSLFQPKSKAPPSLLKLPYRSNAYIFFRSRRGRDRFCQ